MMGYFPHPPDTVQALLPYARCPQRALVYGVPPWPWTGLRHGGGLLLGAGTNLPPMPAHAVWYQPVLPRRPRGP